MSRMCPKCMAINPPTETACFTHFTVQCKNIIGTKSYMFGLITRPKYCNAINEFDCEDNDWLRIEDKNIKEVRKMNIYERVKKVKCGDIDENVISLHGISKYIKSGLEIHLVCIKSIISLKYETIEKRDKAYKKFMKLERKWAKKNDGDNFDDE